MWWNTVVVLRWNTATVELNSTDWSQGCLLVPSGLSSVHLTSISVISGSSQDVLIKIHYVNFGCSCWTFMALSDKWKMNMDTHYCKWDWHWPLKCLKNKYKTSTLFIYFQTMFLIDTLFIQILILTNFNWKNTTSEIEAVETNRRRDITVGVVGTTEEAFVELASAKTQS